MQSFSSEIVKLLLYTLKTVVLLEDKSIEPKKSLKKLCQILCNLYTKFFFN